MDPVSAFGVASGVVQFVDFTRKLIAKGYNIYRSSDGKLPEHIALQDIAINLQELAKELAPRFTKDDLRLIREGRTPKLQRAERQLDSIQIECAEVTRQLLEVLGGLMVKSKERKWQCFRQALSSVWSEGKIRGLEERLDRIRKQLNTTLLVCLRYAQNRICD